MARHFLANGDDGVRGKGAVQEAGEGLDGSRGSGGLCPGGEGVNLG